MPLPPHVFSGSNEFRRGVFGGWRRRHGKRGSAAQRAISDADPGASRTDGRPELVRPANAVVVDANTRTFWARGADAPTTLVEARSGAAPTSVRARVAALVHAHETGQDAGDLAAPSRPRGNPAFSEALFVELMRAHQYRRAFDQLSSDCQRSWGSVEAFAAAQGSGEMRRVRGVSIKDVRYLSEWTDPAAGTTYQQVAELRVEYTVGDRNPAIVFPRVVHLVPDSGRWRSLCYPG
jgi:hypothetical protein